MMTISAWTAGEECEKHFLQWCAECRDQAGIVRTMDGDLHYDNDCVVMTFREITGLGYEESLEALAQWGYRRGHGALFEVLEMALTAAGYVVTRTGVAIERMPRDSFTRSVAFVISGFKGSGRARKGHAWSIVNGETNRPYYPPFRYTAFEITTKEGS